MKPVYIVIDGIIEGNIIFTSDYGPHHITTLLSNAHEQLIENGAYEIGYNIWKEGEIFDLTDEDLQTMPVIHKDKFIEFLHEKFNELNGKYVIVTLASKPVIN